MYRIHFSHIWISCYSDVYLKCNPVYHLRIFDLLNAQQLRNKSDIFLHIFEIDVLLKYSKNNY